MENCNRLIIDFQTDVADGCAERRNALEMLDERLPGKRSIALWADNGYDTRDLVAQGRERNVAFPLDRWGNDEADRLRVSRRVRRRVEEVFGWMARHNPVYRRPRIVSGPSATSAKKTRYIGLGPNQLAAHMLAAASKLVRVGKLLGGNVSNGGPSGRTDPR
jgi:hypothetical protein